MEVTRSLIELVAKAIAAEHHTDVEEFNHFTDQQQWVKYKRDAERAIKAMGDASTCKDEALALLKEIRDTTPITMQRKRIDEFMGGESIRKDDTAIRAQEKANPASPAKVDGDLNAQMVDAGIHCPQCAAIALDVVRPYLRPTETVAQGEVSVVDDNALRLIIGRWSAEYRIDMMSDSGLELIERLRPYLRTTEPVSVSLNECAEEARKHFARDPCASPYSTAKVVLDAAGVKYVD